MYTSILDYSYLLESYENYFFGAINEKRIEGQDKGKGNQEEQE